MEDHLGFIWFASEVGLFRFDGITLKEYGHEVNDSTSLSTWAVNDVTEDREGRIWVATAYGINLLDRRTGKFRRFLHGGEEASTKGSNYIHDVHADQSNRVWAVGSQSLFLYDDKMEVFNPVRRAARAEHTAPIRMIVESDDGTIWCGSSRGVLRILPGDTVLTGLDQSQPQTSQRDAAISAIAAAPNGALWIARTGGLYLFNPISGIEVSVDLPKQVREFRISFLRYTKSDELWIAYANNGVAVLHRDGKLSHFKHSEEDYNSISNNSVNCILEDRFGNIWLGTGTGIAKVTADRSGFALIQNISGVNRLANQIKRIHRDRHGNIWTQTEIGIYLKRVGDQSGQFVEVMPGGTPYGIGDWIYEDPSGSIWIPVDQHGLWKAESGSSAFRRMPLDPKLVRTHVDRFVEDHKNRDILWIGTTDGLCALNTKSLESKWYLPRDQITDISTNRVVIFEQFGDAIWLYYTFNNSLGRLDKHTGVFELFRPPVEQQFVLEGVVRDMAITPGGDIWIPTSFGLTRYSIHSNTYQLYSKEHGLRENRLNAVLIDHHNKIWVSGDQFVTSFDPSSETFKNYNATEEVKAFWSKARYISDDGSLYFGSLNGIYTFHPDSINSDSTAPGVVLTDFRVKDVTYPLEKAFEYVTEIVLAHDQNDLVFDFSGIHMVHPEANQYQCILEGFDETWRVLGKSHSVNYTNLNPGTYTFRAEAANRDGVWSTGGLSIALLITPPFTQTTWFRAMLVLIVAILAYVGFRIWYYQQQLRRQKKIAESAAEYRMQFLSHVSHEIRTPMNAIIGLSGLATSTDLNPQQQQYISAIEKSSKDLLKIINQLLDHSKIESGTFSLSEEPFMITAVTDQLVAMLGPMAAKKGLEFQIEVASNVPEHLVGDGLRLTQVLTNLLANAIKFTSTGHVRLDVDADIVSPERVVLAMQVSDTGVGIPADMLDRVFDRFIDDQHGSSEIGSGLGLYIVRQLIERQNGTIKIGSVVGEGTQVKVRIPFGVQSGMDQLDSGTQESDLIFGDLRILLVDDAPFNHLVMTEMIRKRIPHALVTSAESGNEALSILKEQSFDLIVMDAKMPEMDGYETTQRIRKLDGNKSAIPILGATAGAMPAQIQECLDSGMNDVITKPIEIDLLVQKLHQLTQISES
jgi:signal transduction histidine kinase/ligand-binding sensor domain-containing protein/CheY-like chemotaxis protein